MKIYLASPFSHKYFWVRWYRAWVATRCAAKLMSEGHIVFSPLTHSLPIAWLMPKQAMMDHAFWMKQDLHWLDQCEKMVVVKCCKNYRSSKGVCTEMARAYERFMPIDILTPKEILNGHGTINQG